MSKAKWPPEIVRVEWEDSIGTTHWAHHDARCDDLKDEHLQHKSVGYLVKKTTKWVALTHSVGIGLHNVDDTIQIPMRAVTRIQRLKDDGEA